MGGEELGMKIRVLGCHGSQLPHFNTTSFLVENSILLDAGTVTPVLTLKEQLRIDYIFADKRFKVRQFNRVVKNLSDHYMLVADVELMK